MPNWCENDLYFSGPEDEVLKIKKLVGLDKTPPRFNFDAVIPYPDDFRQMDLESIAFSWSSKKSDEEKKAARDAYEAGVEGVACHASDCPRFCPGHHPRVAEGL